MAAVACGQTSLRWYGSTIGPGHCGDSISNGGSLGRRGVGAGGARCRTRVSAHRGHRRIAENGRRTARLRRGRLPLARAHYRADGTVDLVGYLGVHDHCQPHSMVVATGRAAHSAFFLRDTYSPVAARGGRFGRNRLAVLIAGPAINLGFLLVIARHSHWKMAALVATAVQGT